MTRNWTPRDALIAALMRRLYVWGPGEAEARRIIEETADEVLREMDGAGYALVPVEPDPTGPHAEAETGRPH